MLQDSIEAMGSAQKNTKSEACKVCISCPEFFEKTIFYHFDVMSMFSFLPNQNTKYSEIELYQSPNLDNCACATFTGKST